MDFIAKKGCSQIPKNVKISRRIEEWRLKCRKSNKYMKIV
jgi:hypothetical protein